MSTTFTARHEAEPAPGTGPVGRGGRFLRSPLGWTATGLVGVGLVASLTATGPGPVPVLGAAAAVAVYALVMRRLAGRDTSEIARPGAVREALRGGAIGLGFILTSLVLIALLGGYSISWAGRGLFAVAGSAVMVQIGTAVTEELMFRGLLLQGLEQRWGSRIAIAVTAVFFGAAHLGGAGASLWSALAIALQAGVMLGFAYMWRRSIWFVAGLHFAWNTVQQLAGIPLSGHTPDGLFTVEAHGSTLLTGGIFGLEASMVPVLLSVLITIPMFVLARRAGGLFPRRRARR
ncbi:CPBP family intramembrane glutamic endopeptidase [Streptomyces sp. SCSIO 30461]|uniref:CPBP family intramembrane glutamic endopeptidase n=1 Tax=Streptomyces sp. SCSIO 30461 TaxID=3118085 RepID=UPI0030CCD386